MIQETIYFFSEQKRGELAWLKNTPPRFFAVSFFAILTRRIREAKDLHVESNKQEEFRGRVGCSFFCVLKGWNNAKKTHGKNITTPCQKNFLLVTSPVGFSPKKTHKKTQNAKSKQNTFFLLSFSFQETQAPFFFERERRREGVVKLKER